METGWMNFFSGGATSDYSLGQNSNLTTNTAWNIWDKISTATATPTHYDWTIPASSNEQPEESSMVHTLLFNTGVGWNSPDPHMMCLKLGKRHYCDEGSSVVVPNRHVTVESSSTTTKRGKLPPYPYNTVARWPVSTRARVNTSLTRCQVEGCHVALGNAKEYYRRHKVCEIHSKAPNVVVSGFQQRFCQQCSRFHDVTEFDEAKRSCRRRLQGHNLRRRKGILSGSLPRNFPQSHENNSRMGPRLGPLSTLPVLSSSPSSLKSKSVCALSLLSSPKTEPWISSSDLSSRCSAALYELIVANRATSNSGNLSNQNSSHRPMTDNEMHTSHDTQSIQAYDYDTRRKATSGFGFWSFSHEGGV